MKAGPWGRERFEDGPGVGPSQVSVISIRIWEWGQWGQ